ncbi:unnamed protein product [Pylaiella littoralis]
MFVLHMLKCFCTRGVALRVGAYYVHMCACQAISASVCRKYHRILLFLYRGAAFPSTTSTIQTTFLEYCHFPDLSVSESRTVLNSTCHTSARSHISYVGIEIATRA